MAIPSGRSLLVKYTTARSGSALNSYVGNLDSFKSIFELQAALLMCCICCRIALGIAEAGSVKNDWFTLIIGKVDNKER